MPSKYIASLKQRLDARPDRLDLRDREFAPPVASLPARFPDDATANELLPAYVGAGLILSQGDEGACTGFGLACVVNYLFWREEQKKPASRRNEIEPVSTRMLYHLARFYDEWPGENYDGSSCRGALKAWNKHGVCSDALWPYRVGKQVKFVGPNAGWDIDALQRQLGVYYRVDKSSIVDMQAAIHGIGAIYVSSDVHDGWDLFSKKPKPVSGHDSLPKIKPIKKQDSIGGHAFAIVGYNEHGFVVQNSWDTVWGAQGFATLPYSEWSKYGSDAWVCALGVPGDIAAATTLKASASRVLLAHTSGVTVTTTAPTPNKANNKLPAAVAPWSADAAYHHTVVMENDGRVINRIVTQENAQTSVQEIVSTAPAAWFQGKAQPRLVIYAHGGLNSEHGSIDRIRVMAPYFAANDIYPLFLTWKTGPIETLTDLVEDQLQRIPKPEGGIGDLIDHVKDAAIEAFDRTIEVVVGPAVKPIWTQMKQNADASAEQGHGGALIAQALLDLKASVPNVEIHLVGHSAGSIILGNLIDLLDPNKQTVTSCSLYAPACTVEFALDHYAPADKSGLLSKNDLHIHLLSDRRELNDTVGPYQKSLLYLVSRALESDHKMPILGLNKAFDANSNDEWHDRAAPPALPRWQAFWGASPNLHVLTADHVSTGPKGKTIKASHGCFDNDANTIDTTIARILRAKPAFAVQSLDY